MNSMNEKRDFKRSEKVLNLMEKRFGEKFDVLRKFIEQISQGKLYHKSQMFQKGVFSLFFGDAINFFNVDDVQVLVSQYSEFDAKVSSEECELYQQEKKFTQNKIFFKLGYPMDFVKYLFPLYNHSTGFQLSMSIGKVGIELFDMISRSDVEVPELEKLSFLEGFLKTFPNLLLTREFKIGLEQVKNFINDQKLFPKKELKRFNELLDQLSNLSEKQQLELYRISNNPTEFGRDFLRATNYAQSHIEYFCRFVRRLLHILEEGNKEYRDKYYKHFSWEFEQGEFNKKCEEELNEFPKLKDFLIRYSTHLKKLRNINAHQIAREFYLIPEKGMMGFPVVGDDEDMGIKHEEIADKIIKYGIFINMIGLHPNNPYEKSENLFISLR